MCPTSLTSPFQLPLIGVSLSRYSELYLRSGAERWRLSCPVSTHFKKHILHTLTRSRATAFKKCNSHSLPLCSSLAVSLSKNDLDPSARLSYVLLRLVTVLVSSSPIPVAVAEAEVRGVDVRLLFSSVEAPHAHIKYLGIRRSYRSRMLSIYVLVKPATPIHSSWL